MEVDKKADRLKSARARAKKLLVTETDYASTSSLGMNMGGAVMGAFTMGRDPSTSQGSESSLANSALSGLENLTSWASIASPGGGSDSWFGLSSNPGATLAGDVNGGKTGTETGTTRPDPGSTSTPPLLRRNTSSFGGSFTAALFGDEEVEKNVAKDTAARKAAAREMKRAQSERENAHAAALRRAAAAEALDAKLLAAEVAAEKGSVEAAEAAVKAALEELMKTHEIEVEVAAKTAPENATEKSTKTEKTSKIAGNTAETALKKAGEMPPREAPVTTPEKAPKKAAEIAMKKVASKEDDFEKSRSNEGAEKAAKKVANEGEVKIAAVNLVDTATSKATEKASGNAVNECFEIAVEMPIEQVIDAATKKTAGTLSSGRVVEESLFKTVGHCAEKAGGVSTRKIVEMPSEKQNDKRMDNSVENATEKVQMAIIAVTDTGNGTVQGGAEAKVKIANTPTGSPVKSDGFNIAKPMTKEKRIRMAAKKVAAMKAKRVEDRARLAEAIAQSSIPEEDDAIASAAADVVDDFHVRAGSQMSRVQHEIVANTLATDPQDVQSIKPQHGQSSIIGSPKYEHRDTSNDAAIVPGPRKHTPNSTESILVESRDEQKEESVSNKKSGYLSNNSTKFCTGSAFEVRVNQEATVDREEVILGATPVDRVAEPIDVVRGAPRGAANSGVALAEEVTKTPAKDKAAYGAQRAEAWKAQRLRRIAAKEATAKAKVAGNAIVQKAKDATDANTHSSMMPTSPLMATMPTLASSASTSIDRPTMDQSMSAPVAPAPVANSSRDVASASRSHMSNAANMMAAMALAVPSVNTEPPVPSTPLSSQLQASPNGSGNSKTSSSRSSPRSIGSPRSAGSVLSSRASQVELNSPRPSGSFLSPTSRRPTPSSPRSGRTNSSSPRSARPGGPTTPRLAGFPRARTDSSAASPGKLLLNSLESRSPREQGPELRNGHGSVSLNRPQAGPARPPRNESAKNGVGDNANTHEEDGQPKATQGHELEVTAREIGLEVTEVQDLVVNISQRQMGYMSNKSIDRLSTIPGQLPPRPMANSALSTPTRTPGGSRDRQQFMTPRMSTSPRSRGAIQSPRSMLNRSSSMRTPIRDAQVRGFELTSSPLVRRGSSKDASFRRTREYEQVNSPTYYSWDSSTGEFVEDFEREHELKQRAHTRLLLKERMTALMSKRQHSKAHLAWLHDEANRIAAFQQRNLQPIYRDMDFEAVRCDLLAIIRHAQEENSRSVPVLDTEAGTDAGSRSRSRSSSRSMSRSRSGLGARPRPSTKASGVASFNETGVVTAREEESAWWDSDGRMACLLLRLALNSASTYDPGNLEEASRTISSSSPSASSPSSSPIKASPALPTSMEESRPPSGGTNNCGLGGATLRFEPESSGDPQNHGLNKAAALLWSKVRGKHPRLSQADLWVLAAYAAIEVLGGPRIEFTGGRFDAKDGSRSYLNNDTQLSPDFTQFAGSNIEGAAQNKSSQASRLLPLDCGPLPVSNKVPRGCAIHVREAPTIHALKQHAKRLGFSDRELVAVMLGSRGKKSSIIPTSNGSTREVVWTDDFKCSDDGAVRWGSDLARSLCRNYWVEAGEEADNAPTTRAEADEGKEHGRRPSSKQRYYVNIGLGFEGVVESWQANGVGIYPDCHFRPEQDFIDGVVDDGDEGEYAAPSAAAVLGGQSSSKVLERLKPGESFRFIAKRRSFHNMHHSVSRSCSSGSTSSGNTSRSRGDASDSICVVSYELSGGKGWVHDFCAQYPGVRRAVKTKSISSTLPRQIAHACDLALLWDVGFRHWLLFYAEDKEGDQRLSDDFGTAFKRLTELGFQESANEEPAYYTPRNWRLAS